MSQQTEATRVVRVGFIGAGEVNFGSDTVAVPWNHARVLDVLSKGHGWGATIPAVGIRVVGVADVNLARAEATAQKWREKCPETFGDMKAYGNACAMLDEARPDAVIIGLPPFAHGLPTAPFDYELECARRGIHVFVEKPISSHPLDQVSQVRDELKKLSQEKKVVVSVGYMFRYSTAVQRLREILAEHAQENGRAPAVRAVLMKYNASYPAIAKAMWWDSRLSGGPIVEQCTHFADLARFIAGEVDLSTLTAIAICPPCGDNQEASPGYLSQLPNDVITGKPVEEGLPVEHRVPRVTTAHWQFASGALGSLTHGALMHGDKYECEIEVWGDGIRLRLEDPYGQARLLVSRDKGGKNVHTEEVLTFRSGDEENNFYEKEIASWLHAINTGDTSVIQSPYEDAYKSFELTWAIRTGSEKSRLFTTNA